MGRQNAIFFDSWVREGDDVDFIEVGKSYIETPALTALLAEPAVSRAVSDRVRQLRGVIPRK